MAVQSLSSDFNATSPFAWMFQLFMDGQSEPESSKQHGLSTFSILENMLKALFGADDDPQSQPAPTSSRPATGGSTASGSHGFWDTLRGDFNSATSGVSNFFHGMAFDMRSAIGRLEGNAGSRPTGKCLACVEDAMTAGGLRFAGGKTINEVLPSRNGTHWAKDLAPVLEHDNRFDRVASGRGAHFDAGYTPQVGDTAVWTGGPYGHTQMFTGYDKNGKQVWVSDFKTSPNNWTGLADPDSHGSFEIFRQKPADGQVAANSSPKPARPAAAPQPG